MSLYLFTGRVLPERANLTQKFGLGFTHLATGRDEIANVSILLNQVAITVESDFEWDIFDLRNVVRNIVQSYLAIVGYLLGYAYDLEITRVINVEREIDFVFGIDVPFLTKRSEGLDIDTAILNLREKTLGERGVFIARCLNDLASAIRSSEDTPFYCYRAIEALRHHCATANGLDAADKAAQWQAFRAAANCDEGVLREIKAAADPLRHGSYNPQEHLSRDHLIAVTWSIVDAYLKDA